MKTALKATLLVGIVVYIAWAVARYARPAEKQACAGVRVCVQDSAAGCLVSQDYVLGVLDSLLAADPYVGKVSCHFTSEGVLHVDVVPRKPVLHVIQDNGDEYYMTDGGDVMPANQAGDGLCLATGRVGRDFARERLLPLAVYIYNDEFWNTQVEQVYVSPSGCVELVPRVGNHVVVLGGTDHFRDKLRRLRFFYRYGMPKVGWGKYRTINLSYDGQIVCTK